MRIIKIIMVFFKKLFCKHKKNENEITPEIVVPINKRWELEKEREASWMYGYKNGSKHRGSKKGYHKGCFGQPLGKK
jgi:hypothetical protein